MKGRFICRAMAHAVSRRPVTSKALVRSPVSLCEICGGQSATRTGFLQALCVSPVCNIPLLSHTNLLLHFVLARGLGIKKHRRFFGSRGALDGRELSLLVKSVFLLIVSRDEVLMASPVHCRTPCRCLIVFFSLPSHSVLLQVKYRCEFLEQTFYCVFSLPVVFTCDSRRTKSLWCRCSFDLLQLVPINHHSTISSSSSSSFTVPRGVRFI